MGTTAGVARQGISSPTMSSSDGRESTSVTRVNWKDWKYKWTWGHTHRRAGLGIYRSFSCLFPSIWYNSDSIRKILQFISRNRVLKVNCHGKSAIFSAFSLILQPKQLGIIKWNHPYTVIHFVSLCRWCCSSAFIFCWPKPRKRPFSRITYAPGG